MNLFRRRYTHRGASPGTAARPEHHVEPTLHVLRFDAEELEETTHATTSEVPERTWTALGAAKGPLTWIDVRGLGDGTVVHELGERLGLHPLAISDVVNVGQRPKVETYEHGLFVVVHMVTIDESGRLRWEQVSLFLADRWVLTFQETPVDCLEPLRERIRHGRRQIRTGGADYLACMVVDAIVDGYFPILEHYGEALEEIEERVLERPRDGVLDQLYLVRRDLASFRRATWPLRDALSLLMRDEELPVSAASRVYLRDTVDHTIQVVEVTESYRELAASLVDVYLSIVGQRTNEVMRVLTVVATIFIPLTFLAGVYGMNFDTSHPANLPELGWRFGYAFFWAVSLAIVVALLWAFRRLGWLGRRG